MSVTFRKCPKRNLFCVYIVLVARAMSWTNRIFCQTKFVPEHNYFWPDISYIDEYLHRYTLPKWARFHSLHKKCTFQMSTVISRKIAFLFFHTLFDCCSPWEGNWYLGLSFTIYVYVIQQLLRWITRLQHNNYCLLFTWNHSQRNIFFKCSLRMIINLMC